MTKTRTSDSLFSILLAALLLAGCAAKPVLLEKSANVPAGVDLSGVWQLRPVPGASPEPRSSDEPQIRIPSNAAIRTGRRRPSTRSSGIAAQVFLETGELLRISQTEHGLFISFDRAIVEEYTFGENRVVSIGPISAQRVSGWESGAFVTETLDADGLVLRETWHLAKDGKELVRDIAITKGDEERLASRQIFDLT